MAGGEMFYIFGYGSLLFAPELCEHVSAIIPARLPGYRRSFNKRSRARNCPRARSFDAFPACDPSFLRDGIYQSLVLGTEQDPTASITGTLIGYDAALRDAVLAATDQREGYDPGRDAIHNGYLRAEVLAERLEQGGRMERCVTYLSNPHPQCVFRAPMMTDEQRGQVLINATPSDGNGADDSGGLLYLEGVRTALRELGIVDAELERLAAAVHSLAGPWTALVQPPS